MIAKNWTTLTAAALMALSALPAIGQAKAYTGRTPAAVTASHLSTRHTAKVLAKHKKKIKKHKKAKKATAKSHRAVSAKA